MGKLVRIVAYIEQQTNTVLDRKAAANPRLGKSAIIAELIDNALKAEGSLKKVAAK